MGSPLSIKAGLSHVRCHGCSLTAAVPYRRVRGMHLFRCSLCGLIFRNPMPPLPELKNIYSEKYYVSWGSREAEDLVSEQKKTYFSGHMREIRNLCPQGRLLDIGCAKGHFVELALKEGYDAFGIEISEYSASIAAEAAGSERIEEGTVESSSHLPCRFNIITMFDFLEHVPDLDSTLAAVYRLLKPDGILYMVMPDTSSLSLRIMGRHWWHYKEEHLYYFNIRSLGHLLARHGFGLLDSRACRKTLTAGYLCRQLQTYPVPFLSPLAHAMERFLPEIILRRKLRLPSGELICTAVKKDAGTASAIKKQ